MTGRVLISVFESEDDVLAGDRRPRGKTASRSSMCSRPTPSMAWTARWGCRRRGFPGSASCSACSAASTITVFQYWASAVDWPINVGGKPWHSWPAFAPVIFEVTVLCGGVGTVLFFIFWAGLRPGRTVPAVGSARHRRPFRAGAARRRGPGFNRAAVEALLAPISPGEHRGAEHRSPGSGEGRLMVKALTIGLGGCAGGLDRPQHRGSPRADHPAASRVLSRHGADGAVQRVRGEPEFPRRDDAQGAAERHDPARLPAAGERPDNAGRGRSREPVHARRQRCGRARRRRCSAPTASRATGDGRRRRPRGSARVPGAAEPR